MKNVTNDLNAPPQHGSCPCGFCEKQQKQIKQNRVLKRAYANEPPGINSYPCGFSENKKKAMLLWSASMPTHLRDKIRLLLDFVIFGFQKSKKQRFAKIDKGVSHLGGTRCHRLPHTLMFFAQKALELPCFEALLCQGTPPKRVMSFWICSNKKRAHRVLNMIFAKKTSFCVIAKKQKGMSHGVPTTCFKTRFRD